MPASPLPAPRGPQVPPKPSIFSLRLAPSPMMARLVGAGGLALVVILWWLATRGAAESAVDLAGDPAEPGRSRRERARALQGARARAERRRDPPARARRIRSRRSRRRAARDPRRRLARDRGRWRAARALRPQPAGRGADSADDPLVRHRRDAEGDVHLHRLRAVRLLGRDARDRERAAIGTWRRRRRSAPTRGRSCEGARRAGAARHLRQPAPSVRHGVRLHHAGRAHQREATGSAICS